jgi:alpha-N-acetylglucosaminidase
LSFTPHRTAAYTGWLFVNARAFWTTEAIVAYFSGVPDKRLLVLDLFSDSIPAYRSTFHYFGRPYVWNMLLNFGGRREITGNLSRMLAEPLSALREAGAHVVGFGMAISRLSSVAVLSVSFYAF